MLTKTLTPTLQVYLLPSALSDGSAATNGGMRDGSGGSKAVVLVNHKGTFEELRRQRLDQLGPGPTKGEMGADPGDGWAAAGGNSYVTLWLRRDLYDASAL